MAEKFPNEQELGKETQNGRSQDDSMMSTRSGRSVGQHEEVVHFQVSLRWMLPSIAARGASLRISVIEAE